MYFIVLKIDEADLAEKHRCIKRKDIIFRRSQSVHLLEVSNAIRRRMLDLLGSCLPDVPCGSDPLVWISLLAQHLDQFSRNADRFPGERFVRSFLAGKFGSVHGNLRLFRSNGRNLYSLHDLCDSLLHPRSALVGQVAQQNVSGHRSLTDSIFPPVSSW